MTCKNRLTYLDSVAGLLLINMILWHCWQFAKLPSNAYWLRIFSFFMPWFFFKAGMFYKKEIFNKTYLQSYRRLLKPFILYSILGTIVILIEDILYSDLNITSVLYSAIYTLLKAGSVPRNLPLWFLLSLFFVRIIFNTLSNYIPHATVIITIVCPIILCLCQICIETNIPYYFLNITSGLLFYAIGYKLKEFKPSKIITLLILLIYIGIMVFYPQMIDMRSNKIIHGTYIGWIITSTIGILAINSVFRVFIYKANSLSKIGKDTMPVYCWHWIILLLITPLLGIFIRNNYIYFIAEIIFVAIILL